jgi:hypothetical protein
VLDDQQQQLVLRLTPAAFSEDRAQWGLVRAQIHALRGDAAKARIYGDSARLVLEKRVEEIPDNSQLRTLFGLALAYAGRPAEAVREGERGVALLPASKDGRVTERRRSRGWSPCSGFSTSYLPGGSRSIRRSSRCAAIPGLSGWSRDHRATIEVVRGHPHPRGG